MRAILQSLIGFYDTLEKYLIWMKDNPVLVGLCLAVTLGIVLLYIIAKMVFGVALQRYESYLRNYKSVPYSCLCPKITSDGEVRWFIRH